MTEFNYLKHVKTLYDKMKEDYIAHAGQEAFDALENQVKSEFFQGSQALGYNSAEYLNDELAITDAKKLRKLKNISRELSTEDQKLFDPIYSIAKNVNDETNQIEYIRAMMNAMNNVYYDEIDNFRTPEDKKNKYEEITDNNQELLREVDEELTKLGNLKVYTDHLMEAVCGLSDLDIWKEKAAEEARKNYKDYLHSHEYAFTGDQAIMNNPTELEQRIKQCSAPSLNEAYLDIQASDPNFGMNFLKWVQNPETTHLTDEQRLTACQNFDFLTEQYFTSEQLKQMKENGTDIFDQIYVDGKSMNELYAEKYESSSYYRSTEMMKCEFLSNALQGKEIHIVLDEKPEPKLIPVRVQSELNGLSDLPALSDNRVLQTSPAYLDQVKQNRDRLENRSSKEIINRKVRMALDTPLTKEPLQKIEKSSVFEFKPVHRSEEKYNNFRKLRVKEGTVLKSNTQIAAAGQLELLAKTMGYNRTTSPAYTMADMKACSECFYIDGVPAMDYVKNLYPDRELHAEDDLVKAEIFTALVSGKHRVETADIGVDENGNYQIGVKQVKYDLSDFDADTKLFHTKPSSMVNKLFKNDKDKETRHQAIRDHLSQKIAANMNHVMNQKEKKAYEKAAKTANINATPNKEVRTSESTNFAKLMKEDGGAKTKHRVSSSNDGKTQEKNLKSSQKSSKGPTMNA